MKTISVFTKQGYAPAKPDGTPTPRADDADARALLAEAGALNEGGAIEGLIEGTQPK